MKFKLVRGQFIQEEKRIVDGKEKLVTIRYRKNDIIETDKDLIEKYDNDTPGMSCKFERLSNDNLSSGNQSKPKQKV